MLNAKEVREFQRIATEKKKIGERKEVFDTIERSAKALFNYAIVDYIITNTTEKELIDNGFTVEYPMGWTRISWEEKT